MAHRASECRKWRRPWTSAPSHVATRLSLTIGLAGVALSLFLGIFLGGISGLYGGMVDNIIQRFIEIVRSVPTIPLWMALAAAVPSDWPIERVYFVIVLILGVIGWTTLARTILS